MKDTKILTAEEVCQLVRYSRRHLYRLIDAGAFPAPIRLGAKKIGWIEAEVLDWIASRPRRYSGIPHKTTGVAHV
jgi:prophage regulatory protein